MYAELDESAIIKANSQFWQQMLAMTLEPTAFPDKFCMDAGHLEVSVRFSGAWKGQITVRIEEKLAYLATAAMLMQPLDTVAEADMLDAIREIANMIAGVIKSSLPRPCNMALPESEIADARFCSYASTDNSVAVAFRHQSGNLMICISEDSPFH